MKTIFGQELAVDDYIVYTVRQGSSMESIIAKVLEVKENSIRILAARKNYYYQYDFYRTSLTNNNTIVKIVKSQLPELLLRSFEL